MGLCLFLKVVQLLSQLMGTTKFIFCESWCPSTVCFFIMKMDVLTEDVKDGSLMELLYSDDLVLHGKSLNQVKDKYGRRKNAVEGNGLKVNVNKTKGMQLLFGKKSSVSKVDPCGACGERVGCNYIQCMKCQRWVHRHFFMCLGR